uniref:Uncharacterized protein n=1 Tax=Amphiprion percula TaxID=161767 RepID=A0A3P8TCX9_AMPPE
MEHDLRTGLSVWAIVAIVCNSVVGILILVLFVILYKASGLRPCPCFHSLSPFGLRSILISPPSSPSHLRHSAELRVS